MIQSEYPIIRTYDRLIHNRQKKEEKEQNQRRGQKEKPRANPNPLAFVKDIGILDIMKPRDFPSIRTETGMRNILSHRNFNLVVSMQFYSVLNSPPFPALCPLPRLALHKCRAIYVCPAPSLPPSLVTHSASIQSQPLLLPTTANPRKSK